jgi:hypothetical protein
MKSKVTYSLGDRVAERPKTHGLITARKDVKERIAQYRNQRYGIVVGFTEKITSRGAKQKMLRILWDHLQTPTEHAQFRICPIDDLARLSKEVLVPGE